MLRTPAYFRFLLGRAAVLVGLLALCLCVYVPRPAYAAEPLVLRPESLRGEPLGARLEWLEDASGALGIDEVSAPAASARFQLLRTQSPSFGLTQSALWVRLSVNNPG